MDKLAVYQRSLDRERMARKQAEMLLEKKAAELYNANQKLVLLNQSLEATVEERTNEFTEANARLKTLVSNLSAGLLAEDESRHIILINQQFCEIFNIPEPPENLLGLDCSGFAEEGKDMFKNPDAFIDRIEELLKERKLAVGDELETVDGRVLERAYIPIYHEENYLGHLWQYRDITEQKRSEKEWQEARFTAEAAVVAREQFLANMSHEIRTPMNSILGMSELMLKEELSPRHRNFLSIMRASADNLLVIINDILDLSKIDAGKLDFEEINFSLVEISKNLIATLEGSAAEKDLELILSIDSELEKIVIGDPYRLSQVLLNLLGNAIKFTDKGYVKLSLKKLESEDEMVTVRFAVKDSGVGIPKEKVATIFDDFVQVDSSVSRKFGGTGLGLTISNKLVRMMGDQMEISTEPGKGSEFSFELTFPVGNLDEMVAKKAIPLDTEILRGKNLLLVEDHPFNQKLALAIMEDWGMEISVADNGLIALEILEQKAIDIVLMDIQMPVMDGIEATRQIRLRYGSALPVIALTANALRSQETSLREGQMDGYISKPFRAEDLQLEILKVLGMGAQTKTGGSEAEEKQENEQADLYDRAVLEKQSNGDPRLTRRLLDIYLETTPSVITNLKEAAGLGDLSRIAGIAHSLKPSVRLMGMRQILDDVLTLEKVEKNGVGLESARKNVARITAHLQATIELIQSES